MHRNLKAVLLATAALAAGAASAAQLGISVPLIAPQPPLADGSAQEPPTDLSLGEYRPSELLPADPDILAEQNKPAPACDVLAAARGAYEDPALTGAVLTAGTQTFRYVEVRQDALKTYRDYEKDIAVRVLNPATCTTEVVMVRKRYDTGTVEVPVRRSGQTVWQSQEQPVAYLESPEGWDIRVVRRANGIAFNNWAPQLEVVAPAGRIVAGIAYSYIPDAAPRGRKPKITPVIYVPHTEALMLPEVIRAGPVYAADLDRRALDDLRTRGVKSKAFPGMLLADAVAAYPEAYPARYLLPIEHMDLFEFVLDARWAAERAYVEMAVNQDRYKSLTCSPAGACGARQFMPASYRLVRKNFPAAGLIADTVAGRKDALNATKAAFLLLDLQLMDFLNPASIGAGAATNPLVDEFQVAAYNTGTTRTATVYRLALVQKPTEWFQARGRRCSRANRYAECLLDETQGYLPKYRYVSSEYTAP